jgi:E3 ubiquitin-protein ligase CCNP1IP1
MSVDQDNLRRKNDELIHAYKEKNRKLMQTQELYDKLKRRDMLGQVQNAASDAVDHTIQASVNANRFVDMMNNQSQTQAQRSAQAPQLSNIQNNSLRYSGEAPSGGGPSRVTSNVRNDSRDGAWEGLGSQQNSQSICFKSHCSARI